MSKHRVINDGWWCEAVGCRVAVTPENKCVVCNEPVADTVLNAQVEQTALAMLNRLRLLRHHGRCAMTSDQLSALRSSCVGLALVVLLVIAMIGAVLAQGVQDRNKAACDGACRPFVFTFVKNECYCADAEGRYVRHVSEVKP